jgi:hypothetical protein
MREHAFTIATAKGRSAEKQNLSSVKMICLALTLALFTLAFRIAVVW